MNREILFRGKREDNGEWVCGAFCGRTCEVPFGKMQDGAYIIKYGEPYDGYWFDVIPSTVGQYTGLNDKNGRKIFEGDIVDGADFSAEDGYGVVQWENGAFEIVGHDLVGSFLENYYSKEFEVIGNVHENPELLEASTP